MVDDELMQALGVVAGHVAHHVDAAVPRKIAAGVMVLLHHLFFRVHRLELDHRQVAALGEVAGFVEHISDAARHAGGEVAPGLADHHHDAAGHVLATVIARAFDDRERA